jgi:hypothetical protein
VVEDYGDERVSLAQSRRIRIELPKFRPTGLSSTVGGLAGAFPAMRNVAVRLPLGENAMSHVCMHACKIQHDVLAKAIDFIPFSSRRTR